VYQQYLIVMNLFQISGQIKSGNCNSIRNLAFLEGLCRLKASLISFSKIPIYTTLLQPMSDEDCISKTRGL
jgi:hypothetical protein